VPNYTRTAAGGWVKGGKKAARRLHMKGPRRDGVPFTVRKKRNGQRGHNGWATMSSSGLGRYSSYGYRS
jgi:hypothetical protein